MNRGDWMDLTVLERKRYNCLSEVMDLSQQMGEALDRNDSVSVRMLVAMRQEPLLQLEELKQAIEAKETSLGAGLRAEGGGCPERGGGDHLPWSGGLRSPFTGASYCVG